MGFCRQEYWSGLPCLLQGIFPPEDWTRRISVTACYPRKLIGRTVLNSWLSNFSRQDPVFKKDSDLKSRWKARQGRGILASMSACLSLPTIPVAFGASWGPYATSYRPQRRAHGQAQSSTRSGLSWREASQVALNQPVSGVTLLAGCEIS